MIQPLLGLGASVVGSKMLSSFNAQRIAIQHAMPGRIRLQCNEWKNVSTTNLLKNTLIEHPYIQHVQASPITGSLLIGFTKPQLNTEELDEILQLAVERTAQAYPLQEAKTMQTLKRMFHLLNGNVKRQTKGMLDINTLIILLLLGNGIKSFKRNKAFSASLFFWAYSLFTHQKDKL